MKISDIEQSKNLNEGIGSALIGDVPAAAIKGLLSGKGTKQTLYQQAFLKDFYQDAITSLKNGIQGGFINVALTSDLSSTNTNTNSIVDPKNVKNQSKTNSSVKQKKTTQKFNNYIKQAAKTINSASTKSQKINLTKELVNTMADRKGYPEWNNALATVQQVIKRGNLDSNFSNKAIDSLKSGNAMTEAHQVYYINMLIESVGLTWNDLGLCIVKKNNNLYLTEQKFMTMNTIFENIIHETENKNMSIGRYMLDWFNAYMHNTNWEQYKAQVLPMIQEIEDTFEQDKGKRAIKKLGKTALAISKISPVPPQGAPEPTDNNSHENKKSNKGLISSLMDKAIGSNKSSDDKDPQK